MNQSSKEQIKKAFLEELFQNYGRRLYAYALKSWNLDEDAAWDMIYKTIYKVADTHKDYQFENEKQFAAFVFRVFINYLRNHYRDNKKLSEKLLLIRMDEQEIDLNQAQEDSEPKVNPFMQALQDELKELEDWQRVLLLMRSQGHAYSEISKYVNKPEEQLKVYYQRLKASISKKIHERIQ